MHRKVLHTSYAIKKTLRVRIRIRVQSICCKSNHAWHKKKSCKQNTFLCFILFYMVLYLCGLYLCGLYLYGLYLCGLYLYGFVFVWFVLVWFCTCVVCICMVLYLYGFILFFYCDHVAGRRQYSKELRMKQFSHIMKCERLRLRKKPKETEEGHREKILPAIPKEAGKEGHRRRNLSAMPKKTSDQESVRPRTMSTIT